jgi:hypothetical protein
LAVTDFEASLARAGAVKNPTKDRDDCLNETCVGIDLVNGERWCIPPGRLAELLAAVVSLNTVGAASPGAVAAYLGIT